MSERSERPLQIALVAVGVSFLLVGPVMWLWPPGWMWTPHQYEYEQMILGIYATLGVYLILAARRPAEHRSLISFTVASSVVHGGIMAVQALVDPAERWHFLGDIPALFLVAIVLGLLLRRTPAPGQPAAAS